MNPRKLIVLTTAAMGLLAIAACDELRYDVSMRWLPNGQATREVRYSLFRDGKPAAVESIPEPLEKLYGKPTARDDHSVTLAGPVGGMIPADVRAAQLENAGVVAVQTSPMGATRIYRERAPGSTQSGRVAAAIEKVIDTTISAWVAYAGASPTLVENRDRLAALEAFLRGTVRDDARDLAFMLWLDGNRVSSNSRRVEGGESDDDAMRHRTLLFLQERGYLSADPSQGATTLADGQLLEAAFEGLLRRIDGLLGAPADGPVSPGLARLLQPDELTAAFNDGLCRIGLTREQYDELVAEPFRPSSSGNSLTLTVRWVDAVKPSKTNGQWDQASRTLTFVSRAVDAPMLPDVMYAEWSEPDEGAQRARFGSVLLRDRLVEYNGWYARLSAGARERWDAAMGKLDPARPLEPQLRELIPDPAEGSAALSGRDDLRAGRDMLISESQRQASRTSASGVLGPLVR